MLKFFRKIRQKLLIENKFSKYLLYAIGEIVLVVIGILIALQINNRNEYKKERMEEKNVLLEIRNALSSDLENQFDYHLANCEQAIHSLDAIYNHMSRNLPYHDSLSFHFHVIAWEANKDWSPQTTAFESLKAKGVDLIVKTELKNAILDVYNLDYPIIIRDFYTYKNNIENYGRPTLVDNFLLEDNMFTNKKVAPKANPVDYSSLRQNVKFMNTLMFLRMANMHDKELLTDHRKKVESVIKAIDSELTIK